jgi:hypothetical protein
LRFFTALRSVQNDKSAFILLLYYDKDKLKTSGKKGLARQVFFGYDINLNQISHVPIRGKATMARSYMKEYEHE